MTEPLVASLPAPQRLALAYAPASAREPTLTLLALDARLAQVVRARGQPIAAQLRLAWWRHILAQPAAAWPAGEPLLDRLRSWRDPAALGPLVDGWEGLLGETLDHAAIGAFAGGRAAGFAGLAAELGIAADAAVRAAAMVWALADLAANLSSGFERAQVVGHERADGVPALAAALRPLAVLGGLGHLALGRGGRALLDGPTRLALALRIGLTGR